jgi:deoxyxylulose-5-phosphate synthase
MSKFYFQVFITLDLRQLDEVQLSWQKLRDFIIDSISKRRPSWSGVIELTIALHYVFSIHLFCLCSQQM